MTGTLCVLTRASFTSILAYDLLQYTRYYFNCAAISSDGSAILDGQTNDVKTSESYLYLSTNTGASFTKVQFPHSQYWGAVTVSGNGANMAAGASDGTLSR